MVDLNHGDTRLIIAECAKAGLLRNQAAYVLATAFWESARTMKPVREMGGEKYLRTKKYYPYVGMGYVQLTWKANYERASKELGVDFVAAPKKLLEARYAAPILVIGMRDGWFTGKKLLDYITLRKSNFRDARRIVNGTDKAAEIAAFARDYDKALEAEGYGVQPEPAPQPTPRPETDDEKLSHSKRFWTWFLTAIGAPLAAFGSLDWRVQLAIVAVIVGFAIYAISAMPLVRKKLGLA